MVTSGGQTVASSGNKVADGGARQLTTERGALRPLRALWQPRATKELPEGLWVDALALGT
jgi:hypothetical protein